MQCRICGSELEDGRDFCEICGTKIKKSENSTEVENNNRKQNGNESKNKNGLNDELSPVKGNYYYIDANVNDAGKHRNTNTPQIKKNFMPFRVILILSFVVIFGGAGTLFVFQNVLNDDVKINVLVEPSLDYDWMYPCGEELLSVSKNGKCGYINKIGEVVIPLIYDGTNIFSDGLAAVYLNGKFGYIDNTGGIVIPFNYNYAGNFVNGTASVVIDRKAGFIDKTGAIAVPCEYDSVYSLNGESDLITANKNGKTGVIKKTGEIVLPLEYDWIFGTGAEDLIMVSKDGKYGYVNKAGEIVVPLIYDFASMFSEGLAAVGMFDNDNSDNKDPFLSYRSSIGYKCGYINKTGELVIPMIYYSAGVFSDGAAVVWRFEPTEPHRDYIPRKCGVIDKKGEMIIPYDYDNIGDFTNGLARFDVYSENGGKSYCGVINKKGEIVVPAIYDIITFGLAFKGNKGHAELIQVFKDNKWGILNRKGEIVVPLIYDEIICWYMDYSDGIIAVKKDGLWGIWEIYK